MTRRTWGVIAGAVVANAIFAATGVRVRTLPVGQQLAGWMARASDGGEN